jgi:Fe2+ or Zn2+ uptake regulation protein
MSSIIQNEILNLLALAAQRKTLVSSGLLVREVTKRTRTSRPTVYKKLRWLVEKNVIGKTGKNYFLKGGFFG